MRLRMLIVLCVLSLLRGVHAAPAQALRAVEVLSPRPADRLSGTAVLVQARVSGVQPGGRTYATALVTYPGGSTERVALSDDGLVEGDVPGDGIFVARLVRLRVPGDYAVQVKVWHARAEVWSPSVRFTFLPDDPVALPDTARPARPAWLFWAGGGTFLVLGALLLLARRRRSGPDDRVAKEIRRLRTEMGAIAAAVQERANVPAAGGTDAASLRDLRLELASARNALDAWQNVAIEYFETLERGIEGYGADDPRGRALARDADIYARFCAARGLERITAETGDPVAPGLFQVTGERETHEAPAGTILACTAWGYRSAATVFKPAQVILAKAPAGGAPVPASARSERPALPERGSNNE